MNFSLQSNPSSPAPGQPAPASRGDLPGLQSPPPRRRGRGRKVLIILALLVVAAAGVATFVGIPGVPNGRALSGLFAASEVQVLTYKVTKGKLPVEVNERGNLESSKNEDVYSKVEGQTTIIMILPEGSKVTKGQLVAELDSASLKDSLANQRITTDQAEASFKQARLTREVAEVAVIEYRDGTFKQDKESADADKALAESELKRAEDRLEWTTRMLEKKYVSVSQKISDELALQKAKFTLEQCETKINVLLKFTRGKTEKELQSEVEKAIADEKAKESTWTLEKQKLEKLERQIAECKLLAPGDGLIVYANDPNKFGGSSQLQIEEGATVRERQKIFSLPDIDKMRVNTKVHESRVDKVARGLRAQIRVDAFPGEVMNGTVSNVAPMADPSSFFNSDIKVYSTFITIDDSKGAALRPGMTAQVKILIAELNDILTVPVQGVLEFKGKHFAFLKTPDGWKRTEIELGVSNDMHIEIKKGLKLGDEIALGPALLLTEDERRDASDTVAKESAKTEWGADAKNASAAVAAKAVGPDGKAAASDPKAKAKAKRGGGAGMSPALREKFQTIPEEDRTRLRGASPSEREEILKKAGFTDEELQQMQQMRGPGGGGPGGGGPGGPGGGGPGGGN